VGFSRNLASLEGFTPAQLPLAGPLCDCHACAGVVRPAYNPKNSPVSATAQSLGWFTPVPVRDWRSRLLPKLAVGTPPYGESSADANQTYPMPLGEETRNQYAASLSRPPARVLLDAMSGYFALPPWVALQRPRKVRGVRLRS
jgi:hypothetical protein